MNKVLTSQGWQDVTLVDKRTKVLTVCGGEYVFNTISSTPESIYNKKGLIANTGFKYSAPIKPWDSHDELGILIAKVGSALYWVSDKGEKHPRGLEGGYSHVLKPRDAATLSMCDTVLNACNVEFKAQEQDLLIRYNQDYDYKILRWFKFDEIDTNWAQSFLKMWGGTSYTCRNVEVAERLQAIAVIASQNPSLVTYGSGLIRVVFNQKLNLTPTCNVVFR
jgi:hypothetical protein